MTPEAKIKHQVYKVLRKNGAYYFSPIMNGYGKSGVPDIIVCYNGKFVGIECKVGKKKPTELQQKNLNEIESSGGHTLVINENNILAVQDLLNRIK
jgi:Holliday junction resolvase